MPTAPFQRLTRRMIWSVSASITLLFLTSTSSLPSVAAPPTGFSLELERIFVQRSGLDLVLQQAPGSHSASLDPFHLAARTETRSRKGDRYLESVPFGREIRGAAKRYNLDSLLLASIVEAESGFRPDAVSNKGALGLMQLMPLHFVASDPELEPMDPLDPAVNLNLGARYLRDLRRRYGGDLELALAAYHAGPGTIDRFGGLPPYRETHAYVGRVLRLYSEHQREAGASAPPARASSISSKALLPARSGESTEGS
ncbi:MAG: lytic transglycosylase domain-containing protein [Thermoanaerobaculia bacterium]